MNHLHELQKNKDLRLQLVALHGEQSSTNEMESMISISSQTFNLNLIFSSEWRARMANVLTHDSRNKKVTYFADTSLTYSRKGWLAEMTVHNLFIS